MKDRMDPVVKMLVEKYTNEYVNMLQQYEWHINKINEMVERLNKEVQELQDKQKPEMDHIKEQQEFICDSISDLQDQWLANIKATAKPDDMMSREMQELMKGIPGRLKLSPGCLHLASQIANAKIQAEFVPDEEGQGGQGQGQGQGQGGGEQVPGQIIPQVKNAIVKPGNMIIDSVIRT